MSLVMATGEVTHENDTILRCDNGCVPSRLVKLFGNFGYNKGVDLQNMEVWICELILLYLGVSCPLTQSPSSIRKSTFLNEH